MVKQGMDAQEHCTPNMFRYNTLAMELYRVNVSSVFSDVRSAEDSLEMSTLSSATVLHDRMALMRAVEGGG